MGLTVDNLVRARPRPVALFDDLVGERQRDDGRRVRFCLINPGLMSLSDQMAAAKIGPLPLDAASASIPASPTAELPYPARASASVDGPRRVISACSSRSGPGAARGELKVPPEGTDFCSSLNL
ncbi:hypothetical protein MLD38_014308 [Melastoma candidum]|uniref:Uncharacterized protein n=1 Tax=Melastoma candidum TaxID=119954 RepID=A0ACB9RC98_9MYRT|nr:hypothetical protein MLD38_014308 [Melastoma candidum]